MNRTNRLRAGLLAGAAGWALLLPAPMVSASEDESSDRSRVVEQSLEALADVGEAGPISDAGTFDASNTGTLEFVTPEAIVSVEDGGDPALEITSEVHDTIRVDEALPGAAIISDEGTTVFTSDEQYSVVPLPHDDGSVQIVTVIEDRSAPERFTYALSGASVFALEALDSGQILLLDSQGNYAGGVSTPWAFDAAGASVPTHFEIDGTNLIQVVDHVDGEFIYPISADPWLGANLWGRISTGTSAGQATVDLELSQWGKNTWILPPTILLTAGWEEAIARGGAVKTQLLSKGTMHQQYDCHAFGAPLAGTWNLEKFRHTRTVDWTRGVAVHHCNWTSANLY